MPPQGQAGFTRPKTRTLIDLPNADSSYCKSAVRKGDGSVSLYEHIFYENREKFGYKIDSSKMYTVTSKKTVLNKADR